MHRDLSPPSSRDELACFAVRAGLRESDLFSAVTISAGKSATGLRSIAADTDAVVLTDVSVIPDFGSAQIDSFPDHRHEHLTDLTLIDCKSSPGEPFLRSLFPSLKTFRLGRE
ncbi:MAG: hypothetical protein KDN22_29790 [Verrucomicrobiae bacterium]|nr:hypothetical protein [Verrucomicrobiae bacterium]